MIKMKPRTKAGSGQGLRSNEGLHVMTREYATAIDVREGRREVGEIAGLLPCNRRIWEKRRKFLQEMAVDRENEEERAKFTQAHIDAYFSASKWKDLASYRIFEMVHDVMAVPFAMSAFQTINLSKDELVMILKPRSRNSQAFTVRNHSLAGGSRNDQWRTTKEILTYEMEMVKTDKVEYPLVDLQTGDYAEQDRVAEELRYLKEMKIDSSALAVIDSLETASGLRDVLGIHPLVDVNAIPDTNYLDLTDTAYGPVNVFTIQKLKAVLNHIALFGAADQRSPLSINSIFLSPLNMRDSWDYTSLVSGFDSSGSFRENQPSDTVPQSVRDSIFATGMFTSAWGYTWSWNPNSQIQKGRMYVFTNEPVGWMFTKTDHDKILRFDDTNSMQHADKNVGEQMLSWTMKFVTPDLWKHHVVIIDF